MDGHWKSTRLTFKADIIDSLADDDYYINEIAGVGIFKITKKDFYKYFSNVVGSKSYREGRIYHYPRIPAVARTFLSDSLSSSIPVTGCASNNVSSNQFGGDLVGEEMREKIRELGELWRKSENNKVIDDEIKAKWADLIEKWISDVSIPLIVRKEANNKKGTEITHPSGRKIIFADNSPAIWTYDTALKGKVFTIAEIKQLLEKDEVPMGFMLTKEIKEKAKYKKALGVNSLSGWKLCHIEGIGFNTKSKIEDLSIEEIKSHFRKFMNPNNMFVLPKEIGGIGEIKEFIDGQR